jgi:hypothetical protein
VIRTSLPVREPPRERFHVKRTPPKLSAAQTVGSPQAAPSHVENVAHPSGRVLRGHPPAVAYVAFTLDSAQR